MVTHKGRKRGTAGEWHGLEGRPAPPEVTADPRLFRLQPAQDMREVVLEGTGQAVRHTPLSTNAAAGRDELCQRTPLRALRLERCQLVAMVEQELELACGVRGIILGAAGGESLAVAREGQGMDGAQDEDLVCAQRGDHGLLVELKASGDGVTAAALAPGTDPGIDRCRGRVEATGLACGGASGWEAERMCGIGPVDADEGSAWLVR
jgi:hypothetical protein